MNCRPGDLAFVLAGPSAGAIVHVLVWNTEYSRWRISGRIRTGQCAKTGEFITVQPGDRLFCADQYLKPIRPGDGQDEILKLAGLPKPVYVPAPEWVK